MIRTLLRCRRGRAKNIVFSFSSNANLRRGVFFVDEHTCGVRGRCSSGATYLPIRIQTMFCKNKATRISRGHQTGYRVTGFKYIGN